MIKDTPIRVVNDSTNETRELYWDEENQLMVLSDNGKTSRYTYNAGGERIIKSYGTMEGVYINGAPQGITLTDVDFRLRQDKMSKLFCAWLALKFHETDNFTLYPASILTVNKNRFTKHYFIGSQRIASRIGTGTFNNVYGVNGSYVTAGQQDYAERMNQIQSQKEAYYKELGIAPGVPTEKGAYGDPENTGVGYNTIITNLGDHSVPDGWVQTPKHNTAEDSTPGTPISWNDPSNPDDPQAGYGYIPNDTITEETFFFHSDHLGSTSYITDDKGNITQYDAYLPYGELLVDEHSSSEEMPYKFNGKEFDEETGLYYYGARYYDPRLSLWLSIDPKEEKYSNVSTYCYVISNPLKYTDPTGMEIDMTKVRLADEQLKLSTTQSVIKDLASQTGLQLSLDKDNKLQYAKNDEGKPIVNKITNKKGKEIDAGSKTARNFLIKMIDNKTEIEVSYHAKRTVTSGNQIGLSFEQISNMVKGAVGVDGNTLGFGMTFLHELHHTTIGGDYHDSTELFGTGPVVDNMNIIRNELNKQGFNYGERLNYKAIHTKEGNIIPFNESALTSLKYNSSMGKKAHYIKTK